jgi:tetratricopeptide (TPR) repeat protein
MKPISIAMKRGFLAAAALLVLWGCKGGMHQNIDKVQESLTQKIPAEDIHIDADFEKNKPLVVAILPFENRSSEPQASDMLRTLFYNNFSSLAYNDVEISQIEKLLPDLSHENIFESIDVAAVGSKLGADAVILGRVDRFETLYAGIYASFTVAMEVHMVDTHDKTLLWSVKHEEVQRSGGVPTNPIGAIIMAASTAYDLSRYQLMTTANRLCQTLVATVPPSDNLKGRSSPRITNLVHDGMNRYLKKGDKLQVALEGSPGLRASMTIAPWSRQFELSEQQPGFYTATYVVRPGDNLADGLVTAVLTDSWNNTCKWEDTLGFVNIDAVPPDTPTGTRASAGDAQVTLKWNSAKASDVIRYAILRSATPLTGYKEVGATEFTRFEDKGLTNLATYFYRIAAIDRAGNSSDPVPGTAATPIPPGPTAVSPEINDAAEWFPGANPYVLQEAVTVGPQAVLTIHPGVVIQAGPAGRLIVRGRLDAQGTENMPIRFGPQQQEQGWKGIVLDHAAAESRLSNFEIEGADTALAILQSSPQVANGAIKNSAVGIHVSGSGAQPVLDDLTIYRNRGTGIDAQDLADVRITRCRVAYNGGEGILVRQAKAKVVQNEISYNQSGVILEQSPALVGANRIIGNQSADVVARSMELESLKIDLNYFGPPQNVRAYSSHADRKQGRLAVLASEDPRGPRQVVPFVAFPATSGNTAPDVLMVVARAGEIPKTPSEPSEVPDAAQKDSASTPSRPAPQAPAAAAPSSAPQETLNALIEGIAAARREEYRTAIDRFNVAKQNGSQEDQARFWLGFCYLQIGEMQKAVANYYKATKLNPENINYLLHLGTALHLSGQHEAARTVYDEVLRRDPQNEDARNFLKLIDQSESPQSKEAS